MSSNKINYIFQEQEAESQRHEPEQGSQYRSNTNLLKNGDSSFVAFNPETPSNPQQRLKSDQSQSAISIGSKMSSKDKLQIKQSDRFETNTYQKGLLQQDNELQSDKYKRGKKKMQKSPVIKEQNIQESTHPNIQGQEKKNIPQRKANQQRRKRKERNTEILQGRDGGQQKQKQKQKQKKQQILSKKKLPMLQHRASIEMADSIGLIKLPSLAQQRFIGLKRQSQIQIPYGDPSLLYPRQIVHQSEINNTLSFNSNSIHPGELLQTILSKDKGCFSRCFNLYSPKGLKHILSAKKESFTLNSSYLMSISPNSFLQNSNNFVGIVQGNFMGSIFNIYNEDVVNRQLLVTVHYFQLNIEDGSQPRQIVVYILKKPYKYSDLLKANNFQNLRDLFEDYPQNQRKIYKAKNKQPYWNPIKRSYTLNFYNRLKLSSVKNMILVGEDEREILLLAKVDSNTYNLDIGYPLEPRVALGIVLSSLDFKLVCE